MKHINIRKASGFVMTMEPLGFILTKGVGDFLLRVYHSGSETRFLHFLLEIVES